VPVFHQIHSKQEVIMSTLIHSQLSHKVLGIAFKVHNILGAGLHESAYEEAYCIELTNAGIPYERQKVYPIHYNGRYVGTYITDVIVDNTIIIEFKSVRELNPVMFAQLLNYLKLSGLQVGYLLNFHNTRVEWKRFVNAKPKLSG
jgi:GxxExxY protein